MAERFQYSEAILKRAVALKEEHRLTWAVVAERIGCPQGSLIKTVNGWKRGDWQGMRERREEERKEIEKRVLASEAVRVIARERHCTPQAIYATLWRMGWDQETLAEARSSAPEPSTRLANGWFASAEDSLACRDAIRDMVAAGETVLIGRDI